MLSSPIVGARPPRRVALAISLALALGSLLPGCASFDPHNVLGRMAKPADPPPAPETLALAITPSGNVAALLRAAPGGRPPGKVLDTSSQTG